MPTSENHSKEITIVLPEDTYFIANLTTDKRCMYENNICNAEVEGSASVSYLQGTNFTSQPDEAILYDTTFTQNEISINFWGTNIHNGTVVEIIYNNNGTQDDQSLLKISADTFGNCTINNVTFAELFKQDAQPHFYSFGIAFSDSIHVWVDGELVAQTNNIQSTYFSGYQISIGSFITGDIMSSQNFNSLSVTNQLWGNDVNELIGKHCGVPPVEIYDSPSSVINYYNITTQILNNGHAGTITPTNPRVAEGNNKVFNIVAGEGNYIYFIKLDDVDVPGVAGNYLSTYQYTLENISENHIIRVAFMNNPVTETYSFTSSKVNGELGTIYPDTINNIQPGESFSVSVEASLGNYIDSIVLNGVELLNSSLSIESITTYTINQTNVQQNYYAVVTFKQSGSTPTTYNFTSSVTNGSCTPASAIVYETGSLSVIVTPNQDYEINSIAINGTEIEVTDREEQIVTVENISGDIHLVATCVGSGPVPVVESYYTLVSDPTTEIPFNIDNTPLANFCTSGNATSSITINGQSVVKNTIKELSFADEYSITTSINDNFLKNCTSLTSVDLSVFSNVTSIGYSFLQYCSSLTSVDLSVFSNVSSISYSFLNDCSSLTSVDLSGLSNVTSIGSHFLYGCSGLTSVDLSPLNNVTSVVNSFLRNCSSLTSVDLSPFSNVTLISDSFLQGCSSLTSIDLSPLSNVTTIGKYFLSQCTGLTSVTIDAGDWSTKTVGTYKMSGVNNIATNKVVSNTSCELANNFKTKIGQNISNWTVDCPVPVVGSYYTLVSDPETRIPFHFDNTQLTNFCTSDADTELITINDQSVVKNTIKELCFGEEYNGITSINNNFLRYLTSLSTVDLSTFSNVTTIGEYFLSQCSSLTSVDLSVFSNVTSIGQYFLYRCSSLTSIDLSPFSNVTSISNFFLDRCSSLTSVDLSPLSNVTSIGSWFLSGCSSLTSIDLSPFSNVTTIFLYFLSQCTSLTSVTIDAGDWSTKNIGAYSMQGVNNIATNKVISNTSCELANNFKTKIGSAISNWTVQCPV